MMHGYIPQKVNKETVLDMCPSGNNTTQVS